VTLPIAPVAAGHPAAADWAAAPAPGFAAALAGEIDRLGTGVFLTVGQYLGIAEGSVPASAIPSGVWAEYRTPVGGPARSSDWIAALPESGREWAPAIEQAATAAGIDPALLAAVVWAESGFRPDAVSSAGAIGLAQLMPDTARQLGVDPYDPHQNLSGGARFLAFTIERFGRVDLGLAAYNAGPARVADGDIPASTHAYVEQVLGYAARMGGSR
jgi:soluble lytic murein transglycosylase-like protein